MADEKHAYKPGFANNDLQFDPYDRNPEIDPKVAQTIAYILGWHSGSEQWKSALVDTDGRILVSSSPTQSAVGVNSAFTVTNASQVALASNSARKQYILQNNGLQNIYIGFGVAAVVASGFILPVNGVFADDVFTGDIFAIVAAGTAELRIVSM